jgi:hypothetical protein
MGIENKKYKKECINHAKEFLEEVRSTLDKAEADLNSKDDACNMQGAIYTSALGMCLQGMKSNIDMILAQQMLKKDKSH